jgi:alpha-amylase
VPYDKAFHFYIEAGKPLGLDAHGLRDFANKVERVDLSSVMFHTKRGDFEAWFSFLGDWETAKKVALLKQRNVAGEDLRRRLHEIVEQRCVALAELAR